MIYSGVIGGGFGDECKGSYVNELCSQSEHPLVIRFNGGHQAGHTVLHNGVRHIFSSFGSGTLQGAPTFWSKYCTFFPTAVFNEYQKLKEIGINPILYVDPLCPVTTPYDCIANKINESINKHGTVGVGFGTTIERHESYYKLYFQDLFNKTILIAKLNNIHKYYQDIKGIRIPEDIGVKIETWFKCIDELIMDDIISKDKMGFDKTYIDYEKPNSLKNNLVFKYDHVIFEGAQGILLDMDFGFFPNVTRSNTTSKNIFKLIQELNMPFGDRSINIYYMNRCYQTRHGNGFMSNQELGSMELINTDNEINIDGGNQGIFRKTILDLDLLKYSIECDDHFKSNFKITKNIVITCLDQLPDLENIKFTLNQQLFNKNLDSFVKIIRDVTSIENIVVGTSEGVFNKHLTKGEYKSVIRIPVLNYSK